MAAIGPHQTSSHPPRLAPQDGQKWAATNVDVSKAYHATGEWGKRGMTFQELTRAFDAFNEAEEKVAIGFAWSEDCSRRLEEPLSEVKTIFSDLDGLRPLCPFDELPPTPSSSSSSSSSATPISSYQPSTLRSAAIRKPSDEFGYVVRSPEVEVPCRSGSVSAGGTVRRASSSSFKADEDTIKASQKRRRSLSAISPPVSPSAPHEEPMYDVRREEYAEEPPMRPPSRLGFFDRDIGEDESGSSVVCDVQGLEGIAHRETGS